MTYDDLPFHVFEFFFFLIYPDEHDSYGIFV